MTLEWHGDRFKSRAREASVDAIEETLQGAADRAAAEWPRDTGLSAESFAVLEHAGPTFEGADGAWGANPLPAGEYSESSRQRVLYVEFGFRGRPGVGILRRTQDEEGRELAGRVARRFRR